MKKKYLTYFLLIFFTFLSGQDVSIYLKNTGKKFNYLEIFSYYPSNEPFYKNEFKTDTISFKLPPFKNGLYTLYIYDDKGEKKNLDFILENNKGLTFTWDIEKDEAEFENNSLNFIYKSRLKSLFNSYKKISTSNSFLNQYPEKDKFYQQVELNKNKLEKEYSELLSSLKKGNDFINLIFKGISLDEPSLEDYFKELPFNVDEWYNTPRPRDLLTGYLNKFKKENSKLLNEDADKLLINNLVKSFGANKKSSNYLSDFALLNWNNYEGETKLKLLSTELIKNDVDFKNNKKLLTISENYGKYTVNKKFPLKDFTSKEITKKEAIVIFMSTHCGYCDKTFEQLKKFTKELNDAEIILVSTESNESLNKEKVKKWKKEKSFNFTWIHNENIYKKKNEFVIFGTPTNYFLSKDDTNNWIIKYKRGYQEF